MAKILILGGTGWLGKVMAIKALAQGHEVTTLARGKTGTFPAGVNHVASDRDAHHAYSAVNESWDLVIELSRIPRHTASALAAIGKSAKNWVFISSFSVYAEHSRPGAAEDDPLLPPLPETVEYSQEVYGEAKVACEQHTFSYRDGDALVLRAGLIGGPGDPTARTSYWPLRFATVAGPLLMPFDDGGEFPQHVQVIDVEDLAIFALSAGLAGVKGAMNVAGQPRPLAAALQEAMAAAGSPKQQIKLYPISRMQADSVAAWMGPRSLPLVLPPTAEYAGFARRNVAKALASGLKSRSLEESFAAILAEEKPWIGQQLPSGLDAAHEIEILGNLESSEAAVD